MSFETQTIFKDRKGLRLTDRSEEEYGLGLESDTYGFINDLTAGSVVVEVGSGLFGSFLQRAKQVNPKIVPFGIDLSVGIPLSAIESGKVPVSLDTNYDLQIIDYGRLKEEGNEPLSSTTAVQLHRARIIALRNSGVVCSEGNKIPLEDNSVSLLVDLEAAVGYTEDEGEKIKLLKEYARVLASGGMAFVYPLNRSVTRWDRYEGPGNHDEMTDFLTQLLKEIPDPRVCVKLIYHSSSTKRKTMGIEIFKLSEVPADRIFAVCLHNVTGEDMTGFSGDLRNVGGRVYIEADHSYNFRPKGPYVRPII